MSGGAPITEEYQPAREYGTAATCKAIFDLSRDQLRRLAASGAVRSRKLGEAKQCTTLYRVSDIRELLECGDPRELANRNELAGTIK